MRQLHHQYCVVMYRHLVMFPRSADPAVVDELVERAAAVYRKCSGFRSVTASVDALMGPGAKAGEIGRIMEADFDTLDEALAVLHAGDFQEVKAAIESLASTNTARTQVSFGFRKMLSPTSMPRRPATARYAAARWSQRCSRPASRLPVRCG